MVANDLMPFPVRPFKKALRITANTNIELQAQFTRITVVMITRSYSPCLLTPVDNRSVSAKGTGSCPDFLGCESFSVEWS